MTSDGLPASYDSWRLSGPTMTPCGECPVCGGDTYECEDGYDEDRRYREWMPCAGRCRDCGEKICEINSTDGVCAECIATRELP